MGAAARPNSSVSPLFDTNGPAVPLEPVALARTAHSAWLAALYPLGPNTTLVPLHQHPFLEDDALLLLFAQPGLCTPDLVQVQLHRVLGDSVKQRAVPAAGMVRSPRLVRQAYGEDAFITLP